MDNKDDYESCNEIRDALWKNADISKDIFSEIKFRKNNKKNYFKTFLKVISFILIAALSGGITAQYIINKGKVPKEANGTLNSSVIENNNNQGTEDNPISQVAQKVAPSVVGISNKAKEMWDTPEGDRKSVV